MWKWRLHATNYACKRGLVVGFSRLKDLAWTEESGKFLLVESGIREIYFFWNPESWALESGVQLKEKIHAKELNPDASSTDKELGPRIQKPRSSWFPFHGPRPVADSGEEPGRPSPPHIFRPNWGPKGRKKKFETATPPSPPVSQGLDDRAPPSLKVCIRLQ